MGITNMCQRLLLELKALRRPSPPPSPADNHDHDSQPKPISNPDHQKQADELMIKALTAVFGMEKNGRIKKERARKVVEKLGLIYASGEDKSGGFDLPGVEDEVPVDEVLGGMEEESERQVLLREAFKIFDEDGNGYIEAVELKRVLDCLGLMDKGWDILQIEKMVKVVDLNLDGKVDFGEFQLMMTS